MAPPKRRPRKGRRPVRRRRNPPRELGGDRFSRNVRRIEYVHDQDGDPDAIRVHDFGEGVEMYALPDGSILLSHPRRPLWDDFPE